MGKVSKRYSENKKELEALFKQYHSRQLTRRSFLAIAAAAGLAVTVPLGRDGYLHAYAEDNSIWAMLSLFLTAGKLAYAFLM